jgi:hypothetical protein
MWTTRREFGCRGQLTRPVGNFAGASLESWRAAGRSIRPQIGSPQSLLNICSWWRWRSPGVQCVWYAGQGRPRGSAPTQEVRFPHVGLRSDREVRCRFLTN